MFLFLQIKFLTYAPATVRTPHTRHAQRVNAIAHSEGMEFLAARKAATAHMHNI
jgi:hypothetical protein